MSTKPSTGASPLDLRIHQGPSRPIQRADDVPRSRRGPERLLRLAPAADFEPRARRRSVAAPDSRVVCRESRYLRRASRLPRLAGDCGELQQASCRTADARSQSPRLAWLSHAALGGRKPSVLIPSLLQRQFTVTRPNKAWVTDITYIRTWQGWLYLAVVMDLFSRLIVGWAAEPTIHRELVLNAVLLAVRRRRPRGTLIHSDQGTQYGSDAWRRFCRSNRLEPSMSRKGNCWDNARPELWRSPTWPITSIPSTIERDATVISVDSVPSTSKPFTSRAERVSTESWELHDKTSRTTKR